ncbi:MAG: alpha/beta fold hydrolase [Dehalococcoides mccartyi]|uniref:alpha/beta hydrolase n=1 Tax=Dehalococcoides TaxID=61434 RepID=UPI002737F7C0|nr:alpha/beta fold hydrolase [Dehalococcoides mccartyi]MDP4280208.1 alpha/beta fold hydrolase [Dehalococcoides mccartyi]
MPGKTIPATTPAEYNIAYEDVSFESIIDHVSLQGWYMPGEGNTTIIVMHGGRANRADESVGLLELCMELAKRGFNVLTIDRRGCGLSASPSFYNRGHLERDFGGAVEFIRNRNGGKENIFLLGNSIGAQAAFVYAYEYGADVISGIISDSGFARRQSIAARVLNQAAISTGIFAPGALKLGEWVFGLPNLDAVDIVGDINHPILFISGESDLQIPVDATYQLLEASDNPSDEILIVSGAAHNMAYKTSPTEYIDRVSSFIQTLMDN